MVPNFGTAFFGVAPMDQTHPEKNLGSQPVLLLKDLTAKSICRLVEYSRLYCTYIYMIYMIYIYIYIYDIYMIYIYIWYIYMIYIYIYDIYIYIYMIYIYMYIWYYMIIYIYICTVMYSIYCCVGIFIMIIFISFIISTLLPATPNIWGSCARQNTTKIPQQNWVFNLQMCWHLGWTNSPGSFPNRAVDVTSLASPSKEIRMLTPKNLFHQ